ncbi:glutathione S-transferase family protein [bacterium]|nr:glutathione S-transferase family protein [bacterium]
MSQLINGKWNEGTIITSDKDGSYNRKPRSFRDRIRKDSKKFIPEKGRYHLYVSYACPWAHRTLIYRHLKGLNEIISVSVVHPDLLNNGWSFGDDFEGSTGDTLHGFENLFEVYQKADSKITTSVTVPILWDKKLNTIVNNESSEIIRILNTEFNQLTGNDLDLYPKELRQEIDELNDLIYESINNGVYKTGFAKTQEAYDQAVSKLFKALDQVEEILSNKKYLAGDQVTEADLRLIPTLLRFDCVYHTHFKCNVKRISDYPHLSRYCKTLFAMDAIKETTNFDHIKRHYYFSHKSINPYQIIPAGPVDLF